MDMTGKLCELCEQKGLKNKLQLCRVNFEEGILICESEVCVYPFGATGLEGFLLKTPAAEALREKEGRSNQSKCSKMQTSTSSNLASPFYWSNSDNLCWLDSVLTILMNNRCLQLCLQKYRPKDSILQKLYSCFLEAQKFGPTNEGRELLWEIRAEVFEFLKAKMQCSMGVNDSALVSLNALLKDSAMVSEKFIQECEWTFRCASCGYIQVDRNTKPIVTFPNTTEDFNLPSGVFLRACYKCKAPGQRSQLDLKRLPPCVMAHFVQGVENSNFMKSGFVCQGKEYELCQLIQYQKNPDHFVAWVRNANGTHWAKVDDTQNVSPKWKKSLPCFPLDQVYIAVWERARLYKRKSSSEETTCKSSAEEKSSFVQLKMHSNATTVKSNGTMSQALSENSIARQLTLKDSCLKESFLSNGIPSPRKVSGSVGSENAASKATVESTEFIVANGHKRKNIFEPYIPKKKRNSSGSAPTARDISSVENVNLSTGTSSSDVCRAVSKDKQAIVCDNQSDSGYSSPGSNSSCVSLPAPCTTIEENSELNDIISTLNEIELPTSNKISTSIDPLELKASLAIVKSRNEQVNGESNSFSKKTRGADLSKRVLEDVDLCGETSQENGEFDLRSVSPCDFADVETFSKCENDLMQELDPIGFLENMDLSTENSSQDTTKGTLKDFVNGTNEFTVRFTRNENSCKTELPDGKLGAKLPRTIKSLIYNSEYKPGDLTYEDGVINPIEKFVNTFRPIDLPDITGFMQLENSKNFARSSGSAVEDILEEIFPNKLL